MSGTSTMLVSSMTRRSHSSGFSSLREKSRCLIQKASAFFAFPAVGSSESYKAGVRPL
jgi:hypothetical protein